MGWVSLGRIRWHVRVKVQEGRRRRKKTWRASRSTKGRERSTIGRECKGRSTIGRECKRRSTRRRESKRRNTRRLMRKPVIMTRSISSTVPPAPISFGYVGL